MEGLMNPFNNPLFLLRVAKSYLSDVNRVWRVTLEDLRRYQDKAFRFMVRYAYTVPVYHDLYKKHGVHPNDIKGAKDSVKLPFVTKDDLRSYYPDGIIPGSYNKKHGYLLSTSGSTGKPVFIYCDLFSAIKDLEGFVRALKAYGGGLEKI